jgi:hypothetical protein
MRFLAAARAPAQVLVDILYLPISHSPLRSPAGVHPLYVCDPFSTLVCILVSIIHPDQPKTRKTIPPGVVYHCVLC